MGSRLGKSFMGTNIQFIRDGKVQLRTLGVKLLDDTHTGDYLASVTSKILKKFDINIEKTHTCTTDNAANMVKMMEIMEEDEFKYMTTLELTSMGEGEKSEDEENCDSEDSIKGEVQEEGELISNCDYAYETDDFIDEDSTDLLAQGVFKAVRCAAHTLQLCIWDVLNEKMGTVIEKVSCYKANFFNYKLLK